MRYKNYGTSCQGCSKECERNNEFITYKHHAPYRLGFKYCKVCSIAIKTNDLRCFCCHQLMRTRRRENYKYVN
ncbi:MAG: hypothetical protein K5782_00105 [Nitrosarchaeum sp.]|nr:hypothetical protein [Nitrosarchaeum sp.]